jgi:hypothetical protein
MPCGVTCGQKYAAQICREGLANFAEKKFGNFVRPAELAGHNDP